MTRAKLLGFGSLACAAVAFGTIATDEAKAGGRGRYSCGPSYVRYAPAYRTTAIVYDDPAPYYYEPTYYAPTYYTSARYYAPVRYYAPSYYRSYRPYLHHRTAFDYGRSYGFGFSRGHHSRSYGIGFSRGRYGSSFGGSYSGRHGGFSFRAGRH